MKNYIKFSSILTQLKEEGYSDDIISNMKTLPDKLKRVYISFFELVDIRNELGLDEDIEQLDVQSYFADVYTSEETKSLIEDLSNWYVLDDHPLIDVDYYISPGNDLHNVEEGEKTTWWTLMPKEYCVGEISKLPIELQNLRDKQIQKKHLQYYGYTQKDADKYFNKIEESIRKKRKVDQNTIIVNSSLLTFDNSKKLDPHQLSIRVYKTDNTKFSGIAYILYFDNKDGTSGNIWCVSSYKSGFQHGEETWFHPKGRVKKITLFKDGYEVECSEFDKTGKEKKKRENICFIDRLDLTDSYLQIMGNYSEDYLDWIVVDTNKRVVFTSDSNSECLKWINSLGEEVNENNLKQKLKNLAERDVVEELKGKVQNTHTIENLIKQRVEEINKVLLTREEIDLLIKNIDKEESKTFDLATLKRTNFKTLFNRLKSLFFKNIFNNNGINICYIDRSTYYTNRSYDTIDAIQYRNSSDSFRTTPKPLRKEYNMIKGKVVGCEKTYYPSGEIFSRSNRLSSLGIYEQYSIRYYENGEVFAVYYDQHIANENREDWQIVYYPGLHHSDQRVFRTSKETYDSADGKSIKRQGYELSPNGEWMKEVYCPAASFFSSLGAEASKRAIQNSEGIKAIFQDYYQPFHILYETNTIMVRLWGINESGCFSSRHSSNFEIIENGSDLEEVFKRYAIKLMIEAHRNHLWETKQ